MSGVPGCSPELLTAPEPEADHLAMTKMEPRGLSTPRGQLTGVNKSVITQNGNPGKWTHGLKPAVQFLVSFPHPFQADSSEMTPGARGSEERTFSRPDGATADCWPGHSSLKSTGCHFGGKAATQKAWHLPSKNHSFLVAQTQKQTV